MLSRPLQAAVPSITSSSRPANAVSLRHHSATRGASARRGATVRIPLTNWTIGVSHSGSPPKPPKQEKGVAEGDGDEKKAQGEAWRAFKRWASALDVNVVVATLAAVVTLFAWNSGLATTATVTESEGRVQRSVTESEGRTKERVEGVQRSVTESEGRVQKSVTESEGRTKERVEGVQKSVTESEGRVQRSVEGLRAEMRDSQKWGVTWQHMGVAVVTAVFMKFFK